MQFPLVAAIIVLVSKFTPTIRGLCKDQKAEKGFTLLEVLVAVLILGLAYVAVMQNFSVSLNNILRMSDYRSRLFDTAIDFEREFFDPESDIEGTIFLEGSRYNLVLITSEDEKLMTLKLVRR